MRSRFFALALAAAAIAPIGAAHAQAGDAGRGETVFRQCQACHRVGDGARNLVGPIMNGIVGRQAGTVDGYAYSNINKAAGAAGLVWTEENMVAYLPDPQAFLRKFLTDKGQPAPGSTKMTFKLANPQAALDVVAYLKTFPK
ncbi:MAG: c-type cytochrome [Rhodospirillales bacterium]|jgi:cytochrome c